MKKFLLSTTLMLAIGASSFAQVGNYAVGEVVDDFTVTDTEGNEYSLYEITATGKYVYLDFFFDTCPPCQGTSPIFGEFYNKYGCNGGDIFCLAINNGTDSDAEVIAYEEEYGGDGNHVPAISADGGSDEVDAAFGIPAYPTYCIVGPDNKLYNADIWPIDDISTFEGTFGGDLNPDIMPCGTASIDEEVVSGLSIYPNPANDFTTVAFDTEIAGAGTVTVLNLLGETVTVATIATTAGQNNVQLNTANLTVGKYIVQVQLDNQIINAKFEVMR